MKAVSNSKVYDLITIAALATLIIVLSGIAIPVGGLGVPIVLQNMGIALVGMILGFKRGGLATTLFLAVDLVGVPNMAGWKPLLATLLGPTVGHIVGYLIAGFVIGAIAQQALRVKVSRISVFIGAGPVGVLLQYFFGSVGLAWRMGLSFTGTLITNVPFVPGDVVKVIVAAPIATVVLQAFLDLLPDAANRKQSRLAKEAATSGN